MSLSVRPATMDDARTLLDWRNDPATRAMSRGTEEIDWDTHVDWLALALEREDVTLYIVEDDRGPAATIRFDNGKEIEFSWNVAPDRRGSGLALDVARLMLELEPRLIGFIKADNVAAQRICARAGFRMVTDGPMQRWVSPAMEK